MFYEAKRPSRKKGAKKRALIFQKTMRLCSARGLLEIHDSTVPFWGAPCGPQRSPKEPPGPPGGGPLGDPAGHRDHNPAPPGRPATPGPRPKPRKTLGFRTNDPNRRLRFNLAGPPRGQQGKGPKESEESVRDPTGHPKGPQRETPKTTNHDGTVAPSGRPWPSARGPQRAPKTPLGHRGGRQNSAKQKTRAP